MIAIFIRWFVLVVAVWASANIVHGITYDDLQALLIAALVLSVLNSFVKPLLLLIAMPFVVLTLGLFLFVINALLLWLTSRMVAGFHVAGFWPAVGASLIISVISMFLGQTGRRAGTARRPMEYVATDRDGRRPPPGKGPIIDV